MNDFFVEQKQLIRLFNRAVNTYDQVAVLQNEVGQRLIERLDYVLLAPKIILDLGSGTGNITKLLSSKYSKAHVFSIDIAQGMLHSARKKKGWFSKQHFVCGDAEKIPLADNSVDLIFSNMMFHWCSNLVNVFHEVQRVLKPEGLFLFSMAGPDTLKELRASWATVDDKQHVHLFRDMHDIGDLLLKAHLADPVMDVENFTLTYQSLHQLMIELKKMGAANISSQRHSGLIGKQKFQRFIQSYEYLRDGQNLLPVSCEIIYGQAWKSNINKKSTDYDAKEISVPISSIKK